MTTRGARGRFVAALAVGAVVAVGGCSGEVPRWRTSTDPVDTSGLVWATGTTVHLGDGSTIDTGRLMDAVLPAGDGVLFVPRVSDPHLWFAHRDGTLEDTGLEADRASYAVSPGGRHLAVMSVDYDDGDAEMLLYDLATGEEVVTDDGWDTDRTDPVHDLDESEVAVLAMTDEEVFVRTTDGDQAYALVGGEARALGEDEQVPGIAADPDLSPAGTWRVVPDPDEGRDRVAPAAGGRAVPLRVGSRDVAAWFWLDDTTLVGTRHAGPSTPAALVTCRADSGRCAVVDGTAGEQVVVRRPDGTSYAVGLPDSSRE